MKRLLCLLSNMNAGGAETFLMKLYREIDKNKYQMDFCINVFEKCFYEDEIREMGGRIFRIPARSVDFEKHNKCLFDLVKNNEYKYILAVSASATSFIDLKIAKKAGAHICSIRSSNSRGPKGIKVRLVNAFCKTAFRKFADVKIAPSDLAAEFLFGKNSIKKGKVVFLHNALDIETFKFSQIDRMRERKKLNISENTIVVGHVGRFYEQKNHSYLIEAFYQIHLKNPDTILLLVGDGELRKSIQEKVIRHGIESRVLFLGTRKDIPQLLSTMDVFMFPSIFEGMPNTVIEAQANGVPCVISDSITKQVALASNVQYLSLNENPSKWANIALSLACHRNENAENDLKRAKYDMNSCLKLFIDTVFD